VFLPWPKTVLTIQRRQAVHDIKQSIFNMMSMTYTDCHYHDCLCAKLSYLHYVHFKTLMKRDSLPRAGSEFDSKVKTATAVVEHLLQKIDQIKSFF